MMEISMQPQYENVFINSKSIIPSSSTNAANVINRVKSMPTYESTPYFTTTNVPSRKRPTNVLVHSTDETPKKKLLSEDIGQAIAQSAVKINQIQKPKQICLSGDVKQILKFKKNNLNLNTLYEVYANIFKIENRRPGEVTVLLRNDIGPIIQGMYFEIDFKMYDANVGDMVRCIGKFVNNSRLHIYKITKIIEWNPKLVPRLSCISNFVLQCKTST